MHACTAPPVEAQGASRGRQQHRVAALHRRCVCSLQRAAHLAALHAFHRCRHYAFAVLRDWMMMPLLCLAIADVCSRHLAG